MLQHLNRNNVGYYNRVIATKFDIISAVYLEELIQLFSTHEKISYVVINREKIKERTGISIEQQRLCDKSFASINLVKVDKKDLDKVCVDLELYISIIDNINKKEVSALLKSYKSISKESKKESKTTAIRDNLKKSINCSNEELKTALMCWIDSVADKYGFLSKGQINSFINTLNNYAQHDLDVALRIVEIATTLSYRDCQWAINRYEQDKKKDNSVRVKTSTTTQDKVSLEDMSDISF